MAESNEQTTPTTPSSSEAASLLGTFSDELANVVQRASCSIVTLAARPRQSATGILWREGTETIVLTADHVIEREDDIAITLPDGRETKGQLMGAIRPPTWLLFVLAVLNLVKEALLPSLVR